MRRNQRQIERLLVAGVALALTSCVTGDRSRSVSVPVYQGPSQSGDGISQTPLVTVETLPDPGWPLRFASGTTNIIVYQPQVDSWDGHELVARNAVAVESPAQSQSVYGVVTMKAVTLVDKTRRSVSLESPQIVSAEFPSAREQSNTYLQLVRAMFPKTIAGISLDWLQTSLTLARNDVAGPSQPLNNTPPAILVSTRPAILLAIDGTPVYRPVPGTDLQRVVNTGILLVKDSSDELYLRLADHQYLKAKALHGPWSLASQPPPGALQAKQAFKGALADLVESPNASDTNLVEVAAVPTVYVATKPTELLTFDGQPDFIPIPGTRLLYAENTTANVFKSLTDQHTYLLLAGRWFSAPSLDGPWQYVPGTKLPSDFANIPDSSPKENAKASVPGTTQAAEALIANSIPQSGTVPRSTPMSVPQTDGPPQLLPIEGTPLSYVANSSTPIIKVDDRSWYACQNGVWFASSSINGPWTVASSVPAVIYTIPATSPLHYLTYVRVYGATPDSVYEGYTPGYLGTEVSPEGTVVYGTGYDYPPWIGDDWYGGPPTWGYGWDPFWTPWDDWGFASGFGWGCSYGRFGSWRCHPPFPGWGAFHHGHDWAGGNRSFGAHPWATTSGRFYGPPGVSGFRGRGELARGSAGSNFGHAYNSRTGALTAGGLGNVPSVDHRLAGNSRNWGGPTPSWSGGGSTLQRPGAMSRSVYPGGSFGSGRTANSGFSSANSSPSAQGFGFAHPTESRAFSGNSSPSAGSRGAFSRGSEALSFSHSAGGSGSSHWSDSGGFSASGFSHGGGGGFSWGGLSQGTAGGSHVGGGFSWGGFSHGSGGGGGGAHGGGSFSAGGGHGGGGGGGGHR